jgi:beta-lactam-binding protein with PASTA domain
MSEPHTAEVKVPYLYNEPVIVAEKELKQVGLSWKLTGDVRSPSYVSNQSPAAGHLVPKGTVIDLYCAHGPTP